MKKSYDILWAGTDQSFSTYITAVEQSVLDAKSWSSNESKDTPDSLEQEPNRLLSTQDGVGVIGIHGALTNSDEWYNRYFGLVSYAEIIDAFHQAALDPAVKEILLEIDSPGGAVSGVLDAVSAIQQVAKVKPVTAFTSSMAASAGFWLMSAAPKRFGTATAITGSIGVVLKHVEYSGMMKEAGITETIVRSGEFKQVANSAEPLSAKALGVLQEQVDYMYGIFKSSVADNLKISAPMVESQMGGGREFIGQQGVDHGLLNGIASFEEVFAKIQSRIQQNGGIELKKKYGMAAAVAAAAAGIDLEAITPEAVIGSAPDEVIAPEAAIPPAEAADTVVTPTTEVEAEVEVEAQAIIADNGVIELLKAQLKEKEDELFLAKVAMKSQESELASLAVLKGIVAESINNMSVALSGAKDETLAGKDVASLAALHETMLAKTRDSFKSGGIAAHEDVEAPAQPAQSRMDRVLSRK